MESDNSQKLNPWTSIWAKPRATIQQVVDMDPERFVLILAAVSGISQTLDRAVMKSSGDRMEFPVILGVAVILGSLIGIVSLYIAGVLIRWTGKWMGGRGTMQHIRAALAWPNVLVIWTLVLWIPEVVLFGDELFTTETPKMDASSSLLYLYFGFVAIEVIISVWFTIVLLKCLGQVQGFSAWKSLGNLLLALLAFVIPFVIIILGVQPFFR